MTISTWHLVLLAIFPVLILALYIYAKDKGDKEPIGLLLKAFGCGILAAPIVLLIHYILMRLGIDLETDILTQAFVSAALIEEGTKFFLLYKLIWHNPNFNERFDGIVYAAFVSLGFACIENLMYIFQEDTTGMALHTGIARAFLAVPAHFLFAVIMGYYFSRARFTHGFKRVFFLCMSLLFPIIFHGCYDWLLMAADAINDMDALLSLTIMMVFYAFDFGMWRFALRRIRKHA